VISQLHATTALPLGKDKEVFTSQPARSQGGHFGEGRNHLSLPGYEQGLLGYPPSLLYTLLGHPASLLYTLLGHPASLLCTLLGHPASLLCTLLGHPASLLYTYNNFTE
jgi:hypothetical protein